MFPSSSESDSDEDDTIKKTDESPPSSPPPPQVITISFILFRSIQNYLCADCQIHSSHNDT